MLDDALDVQVVVVVVVVVVVGVQGAVHGGIVAAKVQDAWAKEALR